MSIGKRLDKREEEARFKDQGRRGVGCEGKMMGGEMKIREKEMYWDLHRHVGLLGREWVFYWSNLIEAL